jgi:hypothetical protein
MNPFSRFNVILCVPRMTNLELHFVCTDKYEHHHILEHNLLQSFCHIHKKTKELVLKPRRLFY